MEDDGLDDLVLAFVVPGDEEVAAADPPLPWDILSPHQTNPMLDGWHLAEPFGVTLTDETAPKPSTQDS